MTRVAIYASAHNNSRWMSAHPHKHDIKETREVGIDRHGRRRGEFQPKVGLWHQADRNRPSALMSSLGKADMTLRLPLRW
jgi:hypothetical protein